MKGKLLTGCLILLLIGSTAFAGDAGNSFKITLSPGVRYQSGPEVQQILSHTTKNGFDGDGAYYGGTLSLEKGLPSGGFFSWIGDEPALRFDIGYFDLGIETDSATTAVGSNGLVNINGTTTFPAVASWNSRYQSHFIESGIFLSDTDPEAFFTPEVGLVLRYTYARSVQREVIPAADTFFSRHVLNSTQTGVHAGGTLRLYGLDNLTVTLTPSVDVLAAFSYLNAQQYPEFPLAAMGIKKHKTNLVLIPALKADVAYTTDAWTWGLGLSASYIYGDPYISMATPGKATKIGTSTTTYQLGATLNLGYAF